MPISKLENYLKNQNNKQFSNQTFVDFREDLLQYANLFYKDNIVDFSEVSLGGMLLDFAAIVGDSLVYYAEQQFNELDYTTAVDPDNIVKHLRRANIKGSKASPSSVDVTFTIEVDRDPSSFDYDLKPYKTHLPIIKKGTQLISETGVVFSLQEDLDFTKENYEQEVAEESASGAVTSLFLTKKGLCISGIVSQEIFKIADSGESFFVKVDLEKSNITSIISVIDDENNEYYEVEFLSQSTVFKKVKDSNDDYLITVPSFHRFIREENFNTGKTSLRFGNGSGKSLKSNAFLNNEDLLLPLKNKDVLNRISLDPSTLLQSNTLGISPIGKTLTITYKHGGGSTHNVPVKSIKTLVGDPILSYPNLSILDDNYDTITTNILESVSVFNENKSIGGTQPLSLEEMKLQIPNSIRAQSRIITHEDLISRILTMPSDFGRINKAVALDNPYSSSSKDLFVTCIDSEGFYTEASDAIKTNLSKYINEYRLIGDNFNILDVPVFNFGLRFKIRAKSGTDVERLIFDINSRIVENMRFDLMQIGSPINVNQISQVIELTEGVESIITPRIAMISSKTSEDNFFDNDLLDVLSYNDNVFNPQTLYSDGLIHPPRGGIFEMRYTFKDIFIAVS
jgi:hypothetical protein